MQPVISVIVATYNQEATIARTLESILHQQCSVPVEIIIGEDGSTDQTRAICEQYAAKYDSIRLMPKAPNKGLVDNYFDCLLACKGDYIADCAGDDFWTDELKLEKELQLLKAHPEMTLVHTNWRSYHEDTGEAVVNPHTPFSKEVTDGKEMMEAIITQTSFPVIHLCTALYRADVAKRIYNEDTDLFRNKDLACEDLQLCTALAHEGEIGFLNDCTLNYSVSNESISNQLSSEKQFDFVRKSTDLSFRLCKKYDVKGRGVNIFFQQRAYTLLMHAFRTNSPSLRAETKAALKRWNARKTYVYKLVWFITSNKVTWQCALLLRRLVVSLKKKFL